MSATAKKIRDMLCLDSECTFDDGCGCLEVLDDALAAERERLGSTSIEIERLEHGHHPGWKWWCASCSTLTNDGECDCTRGGGCNPDLQVLVRNP